MDRLRIKLTRVVVPPHVRKVEGKLVRVDGYTYDRQGHALDSEYEQRTFGGGVHPPLQGSDYAAQHRSEIEGRMLSPSGVRRRQSGKAFAAREAAERKRKGHSEAFVHVVGFNKLTPKQQSDHLREHGVEPVANTRASGYSRYQQHVDQHTDDQGRMASPAEPAPLKPVTKAAPVVRAHLVLGEVEHEGDLERYLDGGTFALYDPQTRRSTPTFEEGLGAKARRHGVRVVSMRTLQDVDEDSGTTEGGGHPDDDYYDGSGRYEEGVIVFEGPKDKVKAFLEEAGYGKFGPDRLEWVGKPPSVRLKMEPTPGFVRDVKRYSSAWESFDVREGGHKVATVTYHPRENGTFTTPPKPSRWRIHWEWGAFTGQYRDDHETKEAALKEIKRVYKPPVRL